MNLNFISVHCLLQNDVLTSQEDFMIVDVEVWQFVEYVINVDDFYILAQTSTYNYVYFISALYHSTMFSVDLIG